MLREFPLPAGHEDRAVLWLRHPDQDPAPAREASTVLLVRDGRCGVELFLIRRQLRMSFAAGLHAFPGGAVDPRDAADDVPWAGPAPDSWGGWLGATPDQARAFVCAAVRETLEECGVLPVLERRGDDVVLVADLPEQP